jgi:hypothetical protein
MSYVRPSLLLRRALGADAVATLASALLMVLGAAPLAGWLGLPETLLRWAGLGLVPYAAWVGWLARRDTLARPWVGLVIACNALLLSGWVQPTPWGEAFLVAQALVVVVFAELQFIGLRRSGSMTAARA